MKQTARLFSLKSINDSSVFTRQNRRRRRYQIQHTSDSPSSSGCQIQAKIPLISSYSLHNQLSSSAAIKFQSAHRKYSTANLGSPENSSNSSSPLYYYNDDRSFLYSRKKTQDLNHQKPPPQPPLNKIRLATIFQDQKREKGKPRPTIDDSRISKVVGINPVCKKFKIKYEYWGLLGPVPSFSKPPPQNSISPRDSSSFNKSAGLTRVFKELKYKYVFWGILGPAPSLLVQQEHKLNEANSSRVFHTRVPNLLPKRYSLESSTQLFERRRSLEQGKNHKPFLAFHDSRIQEFKHHIPESQKYSSSDVDDLDERKSKNMSKRSSLKNKFNSFAGHAIICAQLGEFVSIKTSSLSVDQRYDTGVHRLVSFKHKSSNRTLRIDSSFVSFFPFNFEKLQVIKKVSWSFIFEMDNLFWMYKIRNRLDIVSLDSKEPWNLPLKRRKMAVFGDPNFGSYDSGATSMVLGSGVGVQVKSDDLKLELPSAILKH